MYTLAQLNDLDRAATKGWWGQFSPLNGPWMDEASLLWESNRTRAVECMDTSHDVSSLPYGTPKRVATFTHADDAAFAEALVNLWREGKLEYKDQCNAD